MSLGISLEHRERASGDTSRAATRYRPRLEALEDRTVPSTIFTVTTIANNINAGDGLVSLREAVWAANAARLGHVLLPAGLYDLTIVPPMMTPTPSTTSPSRKRDDPGGLGRPHFHQCEYPGPRVDDFGAPDSPGHRDVSGPDAPGRVSRCRPRWRRPHRR